MPVDRPTFSESWYRVAGLKPRLRTTLRTYRQHYRGETWHVLEDPGTGEYFRLNENTYRLVGMLDGRRAIAEAWAICNETMGDMAPTQQEVIQVLAHLYQMNLLEAEIAPDVAGMFERFRKRKSQEIRGQIINILFLRMPLFNPNRLLDKWVKWLGAIFTKWGLLGWVILLGFAISRLIGRGAELKDGAMGVLSLGNLPILAIAFTVTKLIHEFGHAFACKKFGRDAGTGGQVHTMGITLLVLAPFPYVDASSAWGLRNKWHRAWVGAAGMYVELMLASVAAICWAYTSPHTPFNAVCYNIMFISSVATLLFNGNPLIRFDGYYILCDLLEMPNLAQNSTGYLKYLFKRYLFGLKRAYNPGRTFGGRLWLVSYGIASIIYRFFLILSISAFVSKRLFFVGPILATITIAGFILTPVFTYGMWLLTHQELMRHRTRAIVSTLIIAAALIGSAVSVPVPDRGRAEGVVEPGVYHVVRVETAGFITAVQPSGARVSPDNAAPLIDAQNAELVYVRDRLDAYLEELRVRKRLAETQELAVAQALEKQILASSAERAEAQRRIDELTIHPPQEGLWFSPQSEKLIGRYGSKGDALGMVADLSNMKVRVAADQYLGPRLMEEVPPGSPVEMRIKGRSDIMFTGKVERILPAANQKLLTPALGIAGGGEIAVDTSDPSGTKTVEPFFEVWVQPDDQELARKYLLTGQVVVARFDTTPKRFAEILFRRLRILVQKRFQM